MVFKLETSEAAFDNYEGRWGNSQRLDELVQRYAAAKTKIEARRQGHSVTEQSLADGSVKLTVSVGGCLLYTSPSPRDRTRSRMPSSA